MVFFTCNACGQSLKKSHVEKHFASQCRNCEVLACMDCGKDFWGEEYKTHVKCITEEEKYSAKDFKAKANKGEEKQESWTQLIQTTINTATDLAPDLLDFLKQLVVYSNVPRKQAKFENFVRNSMRIRNENLISRAWEVFNSAHKLASEKKVESTPTENPTDAAQAVSTPGEAASKKEKKKKKSKVEDSVEVVEDIPAVSTEVANEDGSAIKKKHKKRKHAEAEDDKLDEAGQKETAELPPTELTEADGKNKKRKKRKSDGCENEANQNGENVGEGADREANNENVEVKELNGTAAQPETDSHKKKKKKRKSDKISAEAVDQVMNGVNIVEEGNEEGKNQKKRKSVNVDAEQAVNGVKESDTPSGLLPNGKEETCSSGKKRKKDKKRSKGEADETEELKEVVVVANENDGNSPNAIPKFQEESAKKSKKSKKKSVEETEETEQGVDRNSSQDFDSNPGSTPGSQKPGKFKWSKIAEKILLETPEKQLSLKKMKKKVFAEYFSKNSEGQEEIKQQLEEIFVSKVVQNERFDVQDKHIRLIA